ncbi:phage tail tape measure protein [Enterococcus hirae]
MASSDETLTTESFLFICKQVGLSNEEMQLMEIGDCLDMITVALQRNGSTWADEVGDNMAEYSQLWSQMGFSASETFQILENGTRNGAYNLDKVNDVVKEIGISLTDGRIEENIDSFSQKSKELFESYKSGGASQAEVIQSLLTDLGEMENKTEALSFGTYDY